MTPRGEARFGVGAVCAFVLISVLGAVHLYRVQPTVGGYIAPQYFLDYRDGFVRRGLPGELLSVATHPTYATVRNIGLVLSLLAGAAIVVMAVAARRRAAAGHGWLALGLVVASPLTLGLLVHDVGRYDGLGFLALALLALVRVPAAGPRRVLLLLALSTVLAATVASEEFLLLFLAPVTLLALRGRARPVLLPAAGVAALSLAVRPPERLLTSTLARTRSAGAPVLDPNGVDVLRNTLRDQASFVVHFDSHAIQVFAIVVVLGFYLLTSAALWALLPSVAPPRSQLLITLYLGAAALAISVVGVDFRRWWSLALVAVCACVLRTTPVAVGVPGAMSPATVAASRARQVLARHARLVAPATAALTVLALLAQNMPITLAWARVNLIPF